jgi:proline iminopeptidase
MLVHSKIDTAPRHGVRALLLALATLVAAPGAPARTPGPPAGEHRIAVSDGTELYVKVTGRGPVCMLIHGGPGQGTLSTEKMGASTLEEFLTIVYVDQRGSGKSPEAADYHLPRMISDFDEVRSALGVERMCLIAHSFGGLLAVNYAARHPERVSSLVMANATLQFLGPHHARMQIAFADKLLGRPATDLPSDIDPVALDAASEAARIAVIQSGQGYRFITEHLDTLKRMNEIERSYERTRSFGPAVLNQRALYPEYYADYAPMSAAIDRPVMVISSRADYAVGPDEYRRFRFPRQTTVILDGGHISYHDQNAAFVRAIKAFTTKAEARSRTGR